MNGLSLPADWSSKRLKYVATYNDEVLSELTDENYEIDYVEISGVSLTQGIEEAHRMTFGQAPSRARRKVRSGDILISTVRTYLRAIAKVDEATTDLVASTGFCVVRPTEEVDSGFIGWVAKSEPFVSEVVARSVGVSYPAINASELVTIHVPLPPLNTQQRIARFLDEKTAQIDALIEKKRALLERLAEKRQALITRAVTKGLNPDAPMKPSGIDWLGDIPAHWEVKRIKRISQILRGKFSHRPRNAPHLYDGEFPFIQTGDVARAEKYIESYSQTLSEEGCLVSKEFPENTLCMAIAANIGDVAILKFRACFPDSVIGFVPSLEAEIDYLYFLFTACASQFEQVSVINTQANLNIDRVGNILVPVPPHDEQKEICAILSAAAEEISQSSVLINRSIKRLTEYRSALITAAVTGQINELQ